MNTFFFLPWLVSLHQDLQLLKEKLIPCLKSHLVFRTRWGWQWLLPEMKKQAMGWWLLRLLISVKQRWEVCATLQLPGCLTIGMLTGVTAELEFRNTWSVMVASRPPSYNKKRWQALMGRYIIKVIVLRTLPIYSGNDLLLQWPQLYSISFCTQKKTNLDQFHYYVPLIPTSNIK